MSRICSTPPPSKPHPHHITPFARFAGASGATSSPPPRRQALPTPRPLQAAQRAVRAPTPLGCRIPAQTPHPPPPFSSPSIIRPHCLHSLASKAGSAAQCAASSAASPGIALVFVFTEDPVQEEGALSKEPRKRQAWLARTAGMTTLSRLGLPRSSTEPPPSALRE